MPLLFSDLLNFQHEIRFRRTLSLPLGDNSLSWIAPEDVAEGVYRWIMGNKPDTTRSIDGSGSLKRWGT